MAKVYDFNDFYPPPSAPLVAHRKYSKPTGDIYTITHALNNKRNTLTEKITKISLDQSICSSILDVSLARIRKSVSFMDQCGKAWQLDDLDEMESRRDMLVKRRSMQR